jgi:hypothetical protein
VAFDFENRPLNSKLDLRVAMGAPAYEHPRAWRAVNVRRSRGAAPKAGTMSDVARDHPPIF